jgi:hypothetical protein
MTLCRGDEGWKASGFRAADGKLGEQILRRVSGSGLAPRPPGRGPIALLGMSEFTRFPNPR